MNKRKQLRAKRAHVKKLKARAEAQAFNQSVWSRVSYRHGTNAVHDTPVTEMCGKREG